MEKKMKRAFYPADILLPKAGTDMTKWAVIACDQFTSSIGYWNQVEEIVGEAPSAYRLTLPEVFLGTEEETRKLEQIGKTMADYCGQELFKEYPNAMIYIERTDSSGNIRAGLVGAIDLEQYDFHKGSKSLIRATEETVLERIPPRVRIRENALLELPHIMVLVDDEKQTVVEAVGKQTDRMNCLYDFELMQRGGSIRGWLLTEAQQEAVLHALDVLAEESMDEDGNTLLFAMGDGNHSLATAKACYEQLKESDPDQDFSNHPARFALVEVVNLHSPALQFEAIHRIVTDVDAEHFEKEMIRELDLDGTGDGQVFAIVKNGLTEEKVIHKASSKLTVGSLQNFIDEYIRQYGGKVDYIHGTDTLVDLTRDGRSIGFLLPDMKKEDLFPGIAADGVLPRKTFSMGHAEDKRYYIESRKIR